ncbi:MAG: ABC transporter ATP-binding protein [Pirellulales bacterium]
MSHVVILDRVTKRYRDQVALDNVTLRVPSGVVFALLGENGAGKTTAIRLMLGLAEADAGTVRVLGLDSQRDGLGVRRRVGYMPERPTLYEWMTAAEIGWFTAGFYADGFEHRYRSLIENFRVPLARKISQMSKGMRAKVALSLALAHEPELLILDEPTSGLDTIVRHEFLESMVDVAAAGRTVILSSHQIAEVERVADIVAIIRQGRVMTCEPLDLLKRTTTELTITVAASRAEPPAIPGEVLATRQRGHQWQFLVRHLAAEAMSALEAAEGIVAVDSRTPSLEEIFVAYMQCPIDAIPNAHTPLATEVEAV